MIKVFINGFGRIGQSLYEIINKSHDFKVVGINDIFDIDVKDVKKFCIKNPKELDLDGVDICIQANGKYLSLEENEIFLQRGAKRVVISAPSPNAPHFIYGINHKSYSGEKIFSTSSCSATAITLSYKVLKSLGYWGVMLL